MVQDSRLFKLEHSIATDCETRSVPTRGSVGCVEDQAVVSILRLTRRYRVSVLTSLAVPDLPWFVSQREPGLGLLT
jgi:hypothetical protein